jgi:hypothetical protein
MNQVELLRSLQGDRSQSEFAEMIGICQSLLSMIYSGKRSVGKRAITCMMRLFPDRHDEIIRVFLSPNYDDAHDTMAIVKESAT